MPFPSFRLHFVKVMRPRLGAAPKKMRSDGPAPVATRLPRPYSGPPSAMLRIVAAALVVAPNLVTLPCRFARTTPLSAPPSVQVGAGAAILDGTAFAGRCSNGRTLTPTPYISPPTNPRHPPDTRRSRPRRPPAAPPTSTATAPSAPMTCWNSWRASEPVAAPRTAAPAASPARAPARQWTSRRATPAAPSTSPRCAPHIPGLEEFVNARAFHWAPTLGTRWPFAHYLTSPAALERSSTSSAAATSRATSAARTSASSPSAGSARTSSAPTSRAA